MDDLELHDGDELDDIGDDEQQDIDGDDDTTTPADTGDSEPKKADVVKEQQKLAWLKNIKEGKKTLDDMPKNLGWLKKDIQKELSGEEKPKPQVDELDNKIRTVLSEREARDDYEYLVEDLQNADISSEQEAQLKEEYESYLENFDNPTDSQKLKALLVARRLVGLKDAASMVRDRRRKGRSLPPLGGTRKRAVTDDNKLSEIEKKLSGNLPPGYRS